MRMRAALAIVNRPGPANVRIRQFVTEYDVLKAGRGVMVDIASRLNYLQPCQVSQRCHNLEPSGCGNFECGGKSRWRMRKRVEEPRPPAQPRRPVRSG